MPACNKRKFRDKVSAELALAVIRHKDNPRRPMQEKRVYKCPLCRRWHLTSRGR